MQDEHKLAGSTRERLLESAGEVFAERGFRDGTIQEICRRAGANIAAVNYHFRDKENLYAEVFRYAHRRAQEENPASAQAPDGETPEQRLRRFVRSFLGRILGEGRPAWHGILISREIAEPSGVLGRLFEEEIRPRHELLEKIVRELTGRGVSRNRIRLCVFSIIGQCMFYRQARPALTSLYPDQRFDASSIERLTDHITSFSLGALRELSASARSNAQ